MALQRKDQDNLNGMFCEQYDIQILKMEEEYVDARRPREKTNITNLQHLQVDCFYTVVDLILQEFNDRFNEVNSELLICMASLSPTDLFRHFDMLKLMRLAEFYPNDFDFGDRMALEHQLRIFIDNVRQDERFMHLNDLGALARVMVDTGKPSSYILVFRLLKLVLTLPVATATVERCFSSMNIVKTNLRNRMEDSFLCGCLICYILFHTVSNDDVIERFMKLRTRREQL
ncbi:unnamed protein product [Rhodiola kirilowii]